MAILLAGGGGYIGSHIAVTLINAGFEIVIADNFSNTLSNVPERIGKITGIRPETVCMDLRDAPALDRLFSEYPVHAVIHLAGYKSAVASVADPLSYYHNNLVTTLTLTETMARHGCEIMLFGSSAAVYDPMCRSPLREHTITGESATPYGRSKRMNEQILEDFARADPNRSVMILRYFNPVGAHPSGWIGEMAGETHGSLMSGLIRAASGMIDALPVYGNRYPTRDGTCERDYIHVMDLAEAHIAALAYAENHAGTVTVNLGSGKSVTVLELIEMFERVNHVKTPYRIVEGNRYDTPVSRASTDRAAQLLDWIAKRCLEEACRDAWNWYKTNSAQF